MKTSNFSCIVVAAEVVTIVAGHGQLTAPCFQPVCGVEECDSLCSGFASRFLERSWVGDRSRMSSILQHAPFRKSSSTEQAPPLAINLPPPGIMNNDFFRGTRAFYGECFLFLFKGMGLLGYYVGTFELSEVRLKSVN